MSEHAGAGWEETRDAVLRGLNHAMSNRVASLSGLTRILVPAGGGDPGPVVAALQAEVDRLEQLFHLYTLLPVGTGGYLEPLELPALLRAVAALHELRSDLADARCEVTAHPDTRPIRAHRARVAHACLAVLGLAASRAPGAPLAIGCASEGEESVVRVPLPATEDTAAGDPDSADAGIDALVRAAGGRLARDDAGWTLRFAALGGEA